MKAVLISIKPDWCELIANGKKTIEVRKTKPKIKTPFKCYIYCTEGEALAYPHLSNPHFHFMRTNNGASYGRKMTAAERNESDHVFMNRKVIGEFVCDNILEYKLTDVDTDVGTFYYYEKNIIENSYKLNLLKDCLSDDKLLYYGNYKDLYGFFISDLKIYKKPKELNKFKKINRNCWYADLEFAKIDCQKCLNKECFVQRPPQSWCYVEELLEKE